MWKWKGNTRSHVGPSLTLDHGIKRIFFFQNQIFFTHTTFVSDTFEMDRQSKQSFCLLQGQNTVAIWSKWKICSNTAQQISMRKEEFCPDKNRKRDFGKREAYKSYIGRIFITHIYYVKAITLEKTHILCEINGFVLVLFFNWELLWYVTVQRVGITHSKRVCFK